MTRRLAALKTRQSVIESRIADLELRQKEREADRYSTLFETLKSDVADFTTEWQRRQRRTPLTRIPLRRPEAARLA